MVSAAGSGQGFAALDETAAGHIELFFSTSGVEGLSGGDKGESKVKVSMMDMSENWKKVGVTEKVAADPNTQYQTSVRVGYIFHMPQILQLEL